MELPKIATTTHNKLQEFSKVFHDAGISMYADICIDPTHSNQPFIQQSFVGRAVMAGLLDDANSIRSAIATKYSSFLKSKRIGISKILPFLPVMLKFSRDDISELESILSEYDHKDFELSRCTLRDKIIPYIIDYIELNDCKPSDIYKLLNNFILPTLDTLGLSDLGPQLGESISNYFIKKGISWNIPHAQIAAMRNFQATVAQEYSDHQHSADKQKTNSEQLEQV